MALCYTEAANDQTTLLSQVSYYQATIAFQWFPSATRPFVTRKLKSATPPSDGGLLIRHMFCIVITGT